MNFSIHPAADDEVIESAAWYEARSDGLGHSLNTYFHRAVLAIRSDPTKYPLADDAPPGVEVRDYLLKRFPYRIVYLVESNKLTVVAFAHTSRRPGYWSNRLADTIPPEDAT